MKKTAWAGLILAVLALALGAAAAAGFRLGWWHFKTGFFLLRLAVFCSALAAAASLAALKCGKSAAPALLALGLSLACAALPLGHWFSAKKVPAIHDISTDTDDPPAFKAVAARRGASDHSTEYAGAALAAAQKAAYPDLASKVLESPEEEAFERALAAAKDMGWEVVSADSARGIIEATAATFFFGFRDDVVVRVRPEAGMSRVDVRSASRVGKSDAGANARRIRSYLKRLGR